MKPTPIQIRLSDEMREMVVAVCADNLSAGIRAMIVLAALHEGYNIDSLRGDIEKLIGDPLAKPIKQSLMQVLMGEYSPSVPARNPVSPPAPTPEPAPPLVAKEKDDDPFADVGEDV